MHPGALTDEQTISGRFHRKRTSERRRRAAFGAGGRRGRETVPFLHRNVSPRPDTRGIPFLKAEVGYQGREPRRPDSQGAGAEGRAPLRSSRAGRGRGQPGELARLRRGGEAGSAACPAKDELLRTPAFLLQRLVGNRDPSSQ